MKALEPQAQVCGVVAVSGEGVVSAEAVVDVRCGTLEDAVEVALVDELKCSACVALEDGVEHDWSLFVLELLKQRGRAVSCFSKTP